MRAQYAHILAISMAALWCAPGAIGQETGAALAHDTPANGGPRRLVATGEGAALHSKPTSASDLLARPLSGEIFSNRGCTETPEGVWCHVAAFGGGAKGYINALHLAPAKGPLGLIPTGPNDSKSRARRKDFDDRAEIRCAQEQGESLRKCKAAVARSGGGDATVVVTFPNGFARQLYFENGDFMRGSATMSGVGVDTEWALRSGTYVIRVDDQKFEISRDFVIGQR